LGGTIFFMGQEGELALIVIGGGGDGAVLQHLIEASCLQYNCRSFRSSENS
jgi:hypothetical protein